MRICSFLPSATEMVYALGLGDELAGVTYECDYPPAARAKPVVVHTRLAPTATSAAVDRQVAEFVARGESLYRVDLQALAALQPDLIITQDLCHVCAASPGDLVDALARLPCPPQVLSLSPRTLAEVLGDIRRLGEATERGAAAEKLVAELEERIRRVEEAVASAKQRPRVACLEWLDPPYVAGHWVPEMVEKAGGVDALGRVGEPSRRVSWEEVLTSRPDVIVVMPCGYRLAQTVAECRGVRFPPGWDALPAVRAGRVFAVDANSYFSRPGPRLVRGLQLLASVLHLQPRSLFAAPAEGVAAV
ncbi:MAG: cobalamin-binding protein [Acidobacteria bacterium]|nr:cobalamin-binding protein [Acidobacteriota bacterium]